MTDRHRLILSGRDVIALLLLFLAVAALFLPALTGRRGIFHDDQAMAEFPWHFFLARHFQEGVIPLWEPDTWCGAIPFYARYYMDTYYFPLWPLYLLSDLSNLVQSYWLLSLVPLLLHYWLAAAGMYLFARRAIRLRPPGAFVAGWVYLFSPAFAYSYVWFPIVAVQAWLPWLLWVVVSMDRAAGLRKVAGAGVLIALMILAAQPPHLGYSLFLAGLLALALGSRHLIGRRKRLFFRAPLQLAAALMLGVLLSAVFWFPVLDGARHTEQHLDMTYAAMTGGDGSLHPVYLATLFIPDLFGTVSGIDNRNWVEAVSPGVRFWEANLSGGLILTFLVLVGVWLGVGRRQPRRRRFWIFLSILVWVFAVLAALGRYTPFYHLFFKSIPILSFFPFPIRYRLFQVIATAWLAGLGTEALLSGRRPLSPRGRRLVWAYLGLALLAGLAALAGRAGLRALAEGRIFLPGWEEIVRAGGLGWFLRGPVLYFVTAGFLLAASWLVFRGKRRAAVLAGLAGLEAAFFALSAFYFCTFRYHDPRPEHRRSPGPSAHPMVRRVLGTLAAYRDDPEMRWASDQPFHDNFARLEGSFALMGYDMKPLERRFKRAFESAYGQPADWPLYWYYPRPEYAEFLGNMSAAYLLDSRAKSPFPEGSTEKVESDPDFYLHRNPKALPRAFVMDRVVACSEEEAMEELVKGDLRRGVFVVGSEQSAVSSEQLAVSSEQSAVSGEQLAVSGEQLAVSSEQSAVSGEQLPEGGVAGPLTAYCLPLTAYHSLEPGSEEDYLSYFDELQRMNHITRLDFSNPNRVEVDVEMTAPAMLVLTELWYPGWEARVDGREAPLYRVNYLQRGVWLEPGEHRVEMDIRPRAWQRGAAVSSVSWGMMILGFLGWGIRSVSKSRRTVTGPRPSSSPRLSG